MWKDVPNYEGLYEINEYGEVKNKKRGTYKLPFINDNGYKVIELWKNNIPKKFSVHRLVAMTFIPNPNNLPIVMHKDNNPLNNHVSNLKWGTISENTKQAFDDGLIVSKGNPKCYVYKIVNEDESDKILCYGYKEIHEKIGYGTMATIHNAIAQQGRLRYGPYKGYRIKRAEFDKNSPIRFYY